MDGSQFLGQPASEHDSSADQQSCEDDCFCCYCSHVVTVGSVVVVAPVDVAMLPGEASPGSPLPVSVGLFRPPRG